MTVVDLGAGTGYFLRYLSEAIGHEGRVLALDLSRSSIDWMSSRIEREGLQNVRPVMVAPDDPALSPRSVDRIRSSWLPCVLAASCSSSTSRSTAPRALRRR
jgi:cyclopropane fatty-acyl-phospholipid synthase-like methyltransferase